MATMNTNEQVTTLATPHTRESVLATLAAHRDKLREFGVRRLALFGSVVRNEARDDSDIDVLVDLQETTFRTFMGLKIFLEELFGRAVDLVMFRNLKSRIRDRVLKEAVDVEGL